MDLNLAKQKLAAAQNKGGQQRERIDYTKINPAYKKIFVVKSNTIFDYGKLIGDAEEVHCVDSSFKHIVDSIPTKGKLYYHKYYKAKHGESENHQYKKDWVIV